MAKTPPVSSTSSVRLRVEPVIQRKIWVLGSSAKRAAPVVEAIEEAGHLVRVGEPGSELAPSLREFRPDLIIIDMQEQPERGRHVGGQLRADRATRQVPIILVGLGTGEEAEKFEKAVTGPTRRYPLPLDAPSVVAAIVAEV